MAKRKSRRTVNVHAEVPADADTINVRLSVKHDKDENEKPESKKRAGKGRLLG